MKNIISAALLAFLSSTAHAGLGDGSRKNQVDNIAIAIGTSDQSLTSTAYTGVDGSTVTLTVGPNSRVLLELSATLRNDTDGQGCFVQLMQGSTVLNTGTVGSCGVSVAAANARQHCGITKITSVLAAGTYSFSVMYKATGASTCIFNGADANWTFIAEELRF